MSEKDPLARAYRRAQRAIADLKSAVYTVVASAEEMGCTNAQVGRSLGIYGDTLGTKATFLERS
jgi:hypothetical protein